MSRTGSEIAIVGMSIRVPGARTVSEFWHNVHDGVESMTVLTDNELRKAGVSESELHDPAYVRVSAVLDGIDSWDAPFFGFSPKDAAIMDPQHRLFLECSWEALEDAGHAAEKFGGPIGVFAGCGMQAYMMFNLLPNKRMIDEVGLFLVRHTGNDKDFLSTRVSYSLDLRGPSVNVQTACSTSLAAVHLASQSLLSGECDMALAGGVTITLPHRVGYKYEEGEILSPDGHCRPFDAAAQGTVFGSGAGVVVLRRLDDAIADSDHIYAVVRGSALNNDGSNKVSYLAPSVDGQAAAIAEAIAIAEVDPASVSFIEAHGTGTAVGDPIEVAALTQAYGSTGQRRRCALGSVKANIGHLDTAAGIISLAKAALALEHGVIPPTVNYCSPNPAIDFDSGPFYVSAQPVPWPRGPIPRRAGVSSLGVGGTNVHVILEEAPAVERSPEVTSAQTLLCLSAKTRWSLDTASSNLADHLRNRNDVRLSDVAFTLGTRREFRERKAVLCSTLADAQTALRISNDRRRSVTASASTERSVAFMFAGGGAQYPGMGRSLYQSERVYRDAVDECLDFVDQDSRRVLRTLLNGDRSSPDLAGQLERPSLGLPALLTSQVAMTRLLASWGVAPNAMIGHSMGEYTAAYLAGVFSLRDALRLVQVRGRLFEQVPGGGMLGVPLPADSLQSLLGDDLSIAAENAPQVCVASGPIDALRRLEHRLSREDVECSRVRIDVAAHSWMLDGILDEFRQFVASIALSPPTVPFVSNLTGDWIREAEATDPEYWVRHLRSTVRFSAGITLLMSDPSRALVEVGPGRTMATLARLNTGSARDAVVVTSMASADETSVGDCESALLGVGELWCHGVPVDLPALQRGERRHRVPLTTYAFERSKHWVDAPPPAAIVDADGNDSRRPWEEWFYVAEWERIGGAVAAVPISNQPRVSVLLDDETPFGCSLADELRSRGEVVVTVRRGGVFRRSEPFNFVIDPRSADDYVRLVEAVSTVTNGGAVRFLHLWTVTGDIGSQEDAEERAFYSILRLAQAWAHAGLDASAELCLLTAGLWKVGGESLDQPWRSLALGPMRVIPAEYPNLRTRVIDIASIRDTEVQRTARQAARELDLQPTAHEEIALRGGERWRRVFRRIELAPGTGTLGALKQQGVYLITGGFGGIGALLAEQLACRFSARLILVGRHAIGSAASGVISRCASAGGQVLALTADITDPRDTKRVVDEARGRFGRIDGVFHAAGVLDDGLMQLRADGQCAAVMAPKVRGTLALDEALGDDEHLLFVLFSSISAEAGLPGQVDYAAASAFLDSFATSRRERKAGLTISVQWGTWVDVGMAARLAQPLGLPAPDEAGPLRRHLITHRLQGSGGADMYAGRLGCDTHWLVGQHRLRSGQALIPGTGYLELACEAFTALEPSSALEIRDVAFLSPFVVNDGQEREFRVALAHSPGSTRFAVLGADDQTADGNTDWIEHASGLISVVTPVEAATTVPLDEIRARCSGTLVGGPDLASHPFLDLGARWDCIREVRFGDSEALGRLSLPEAFRGEVREYHLHPALLDMATACALRLVPGFDPAADFYVPLSYTMLRTLAPMPSEVYSHVRLCESDLDPHEVAVFDVTIYSAEGSVVAEIEGFMMTRMADRSALVRPMTHRRRAGTHGIGTGISEQATSRASSLPHDGIRSGEGIDAFLRLLDAEAPSNVTVTWRHPLAVIRELHRLAAPTPTPAKTANAQPEAVPDVERALAGHEAVGACAAVARQDRTGAVRIVAYVVFKPDQQATVSELRRFTKQLVDEHLVPASFITMDALPRTESGQTDRAALPDPYGAADQPVAPRTEIERTVADTWKEVLGVDNVSVHDNFFDVGGHSLLAVRVVTRLDRKLGVRLSQAALVLQTLEQLAAECERQRSGAVVRSR